jgi:hypothetical protein
MPGLESSEQDRGRLYQLRHAALHDISKVITNINLGTIIINYKA